MDFNTILFSLLGALIATYAILDGFDFGVGCILFLTRSEEERDLLIASIGPVWDGNQVWLLAIADVLFGAFPLAFTTVFSGFYVAFMLLLTALVARSVATEYRHMHSSARWIRVWDSILAGGCLGSAVVLGIAAGNVLRGLPLRPGFTWQGTFLGLLNPYAILIGTVSTTLFVMHGALYLRMKTDGELCNRLGRIALRAYYVFLLLYGAAAAATVYVSPFLFGKVGSPLFWDLAVLLTAALASIPFALQAERKATAFLTSSAAIALMVMLTALSLYPVLVPSSLGHQLSLTIYNAASTHGTLVNMLVIASIGIPIVLGYTFVVYRIFRGLARPGQG